MAAPAFAVCTGADATAIKCIAQVSAGVWSSNVLTTGNVDSTGGQLEVVKLTDFGSDFPIGTPVTDSGGSTWTRVHPVAQSCTRCTSRNGNSMVEYWYCAGVNCVVSASQNFSYTNPSRTGSISVAVFKGFLAPSLDQAVGIVQANVSQTSWQNGNLTPTNPLTLFISDAIITNTGVTITGTPAGFTIIASVSNGSIYGGEWGYLITSAAQNPTWSYSGGEIGSGANVIFGPAAPSGRVQHKVQSNP